MYSNLNAPPTLGANVPPNMAPNVAPMPMPMPSFSAPAYDCGYGYAAPMYDCGYGYAAPIYGCTNQNSFILIVVLFILLIIVGASFYSCSNWSHYLICYLLLFRTHFTELSVSLEQDGY